eukprot:2412054-Rhodomonas_salina.2
MLPGNPPGSDRDLPGHARGTAGGTRYRIDSACRSGDVQTRTAGFPVPGYPGEPHSRKVANKGFLHWYSGSD